MLDDGTLTHRGIHHLFADKFEGLQFTLQVIQKTYDKSESNKLQAFISDGQSWIQGYFVGNAKQLFQRYILNTASNIGNHTIIKFGVGDIKICQKDHTFQLMNIKEVKNVQKIIGQPIPYQIILKNGFINTQPQKVQKIADAVKIYSIKEVKDMQVGKISGAILAKVVQRPNNVKGFMNIKIQDQHRDKIQCCLFGSECQKYKSILTDGCWYRFEDPLLQMNNKIEGQLQLKINMASKIEKVRHEQLKSLNLQYKSTYVNNGVLNQQSKPMNNSLGPNGNKFQEKKYGRYEQIEFNQKKFNMEGDHRKIDYFTIVIPTKITRITNGFPRRVVNCIDKNGSFVEITIWNQYDHIQIVQGQTYIFRKMQAKLYHNKIGLTTRKRFSTILKDSGKIIHKKNFRGFKKSNNIGNFKTLNQQDNPVPLIVFKDSNQALPGNKYEGLTYATIILKSFKYGEVKKYKDDIRKKLIRFQCLYCKKDSYVRSNFPQPTIIQGVIVCSQCHKSDIEVMWNISVILADKQVKVQDCKLNDNITTKLLQITPQRAIYQFHHNYENLKQIAYKKINYLHGVFKIISKPNKDQGKYYNIVQFFANSSEFEVKRSKQRFDKIVNTYKIHMTKSHNNASEQLSLPPKNQQNKIQSIKPEPMQIDN